MPAQITPWDSGLTKLDHERPLILEGVNHLTISKFSSQPEGNYTCLLDSINDGWINLTKDEQQIQKIRLWIDGTRDRADAESNTTAYEGALNKQLEGTCQWLFQNSTFQKWGSRSPQSGSRSLLWVTGSGGEGKSVLCSSVIQHIRGFDRKLATPYIMITYGVPRTKLKMASLLASQLLEHLVDDGIDTEVLSLLRRSSTVVENLYELIRILLQQCTTVYFFIDGLDEIAISETKNNDLSEHLRLTVKFVVDLTRNKSLDVRLWCSSQKSETIEKWMREFDATELTMNKLSVSRDIQKYLNHVQEKALRLLPESERGDATKLLLIRARTNFRWAFLIQDTLDGCPTTEKLEEIIRQGVPGDLGPFYYKRLQELRTQDQDDSRRGFPTLSINILSLLAFARRPLRVKELREALSIVGAKWLNQNGDCKSLSNKTLIQGVDIIYRCKMFVDFVRLPRRLSDTAPRDPEDGYLLISHGSVFKFLRGAMGNEETLKQDQTGAASFSVLASSSQPTPLVDASIIANACLKYLSQTRYARPLNKISPVEFETKTAPSENISDHAFLCYAAKHWYRHLQEVQNPPMFCENVKIFLLSPQFLTAIQVQSLFAVGHFINDFDHSRDGTPIYGERRLRRNLPEWFRTCSEGNTLAHSYEVLFIAEWSNFLQLGSTEDMNGEIDRCFWGALGPEHFMYRHGVAIERNKSYLLEDGADSTELARGQENRKCCFYDTISSDGMRVSTWQVSAW